MGEDLSFLIEFPLCCKEDTYKFNTTPYEVQDRVCRVSKSLVRDNEKLESLLELYYHRVLEFNKELTVARLRVGDYEIEIGVKKEGDNYKLLSPIIKLHRDSNLEELTLHIHRPNIKPEHLYNIIKSLVERRGNYNESISGLLNIISSYITEESVKRKIKELYYI